MITVGSSCLQKTACDTAAIEDTVRRHVPVATLVSDVSSPPTMSPFAAVPCRVIVRMQSSFILFPLLLHEKTAF
jgi:hypothetical protein